MKKILVTLFVCIMAFSASAQTSLEQSILFQKDSVNIPESQIERVEMIAKYIRKHPAQTIIIGGFTSQSIPASQVQEIADKRAEAVRKCLVEQFHISNSRLVTIGVGVSTKYKEPEFNEVVEFFTR